MAEFINFEAEAEVVEVEDDKEDDEVSNISEGPFIDDHEVDFPMSKMILTKI